MKKLKIHNKESGFTLVEALVSIGILVIAVFGAFTAAQSGLSSSNFSKEQIIAFNLAQEGMEQIRNIRDRNGINGQPWLAGISDSSGDPCYFGRACTVDVINSNNPIACNAPGECPFLRYQASTGFYGYTPSWTLTSFKREIELSQVNSHEVSVLVTISWDKGLLHNSFRVRENILDWQ